MATFGNTSKERLITCHNDLQLIMENTIKYMDFSITYGVRTDKEQQDLYAKGRVLEDGGWRIIGPIVTNCDGIVKKSKHQPINGVSNAVDIVPFSNGSMQWNDDKLWKKLSREVWKSIQMLLLQGKISNEIRWGGFWTSMVDKPHWEIK